jgi:hypothetical protein
MKRSALAGLIGCVLVLSGCAKTEPRGESTQSTAAATTTATAPGPAAAANETPADGCSKVFGRMAGDKPGSTAPIPAGFPAPPAGSQLCGETFMHEVWFVNSSMADDALLDYYRKQLTAAGYAVDKVDHTSGGDQRMDFSRAGVTGYVGTVGDKDSMSRRFKDVVKIAYHALPGK